jgi:hypothetical protein
MWKLKKAMPAVFHRCVAKANDIAATTIANGRLCSE